jgi:hypothetical protein
MKPFSGEIDEEFSEVISTPLLAECEQRDDWFEFWFTDLRDYLEGSLRIANTVSLCFLDEL